MRWGSVSVYYLCIGHAGGYCYSWVCVCVCLGRNWRLLIGNWHSLVGIYVLLCTLKVSGFGWNLTSTFYVVSDFSIFTWRYLLIKNWHNFVEIFVMVPAKRDYISTAFDLDVLPWELDGNAVWFSFWFICLVLLSVLVFRCQLFISFSFSILGQTPNGWIETMTDSSRIINLL